MTGAMSKVSSARSSPRLRSRIHRRCGSLVHATPLFASGNAPAIDSRPRCSSPPPLLRPAGRGVASRARRQYRRLLRQKLQPFRRCRNAPMAFRPRTLLSTTLEKVQCSPRLAPSSAGRCPASMATLIGCAPVSEGILAQSARCSASKSWLRSATPRGRAEGRELSDAHPDSPHTAKLRRFIIEP